MDGPPAKRYNTRAPTKNSEIEQPLIEWFNALKTRMKEVNGNNENKEVNKEVNGKMILRGAKKIAKKLGADADALNESWLQRWRERHGIHYKALHGEAGDCHAFEEWLAGIKLLEEVSVDVRGGRAGECRQNVKTLQEIRFQLCLAICNFPLLECYRSEIHHLSIKTGYFEQTRYFELFSMQRMCSKYPVSSV